MKAEPGNAGDALPKVLPHPLVDASRNPAKWWPASGSPLLPIWWTLWLVTGVVHQIGARIIGGENGTLTSLRDGTKVMIVAGLFDIALSLATMGVVLLIAKAQRVATANTDSPSWPAEHWDDDEHFVPRRP
jgi:Domain of unknown function (DUF4328)